MKTKTLRHYIWTLRKNLLSNLKKAMLIIKRKSKVIYRKLVPFIPSNSYTFAILCIKKEAYVDLVIRQANSLHYYNPTHKFVVYTDNICSEVLEKNRSLFDYPNQITIKNAFENPTQSWTYYKMEMRIENSRLGGIDIDADMVWHGDPVIDRTRPIMFAPVFVFSEYKPQKDLILEIFRKPEWVAFTHFVSAFVSIPPEFMTNQLENDARMYVKMILDNPLTFMSNQSDRDETYRVSEEISICLALQSNYPGLTKSLKIDGNKKDKYLLEPIYYGCENKIVR